MPESIRSLAWALLLPVAAFFIALLYRLRCQTNALEAEVTAYRVNWGRYFGLHETRLDALEKLHGLGCEARLAAKQKGAR